MSQAPEATPWQTTQFRAASGEPTQPNRPVVMKVHSQILGGDCPRHPETHGDKEPKVLSREFPQAKLVPSLAEWEQAETDAWVLALSLVSAAEFQTTQACPVGWGGPRCGF